MSITRFSKDFVKTCVAYKIAKVSIVRDYEIMEEHEKGLSFQQIATKFGLTRMQICNIVHKYENK